MSGLTDEQLERLVEAAMCTIDQCEEDQCARFATWSTWEHGNHHGSLLVYCDEHCPPCTEERGGYCKEQVDGWRLAKELNNVLAAAAS